MSLFHTDSTDECARREGLELPFIPDRFSEIAQTFLHPHILCFLLVSSYYVGLPSLNLELFNRTVQDIDQIEKGVTEMSIFLVKFQIEKNVSTLEVSFVTYVTIQ